MGKGGYVKIINNTSKSLKGKSDFYQMNAFDFPETIAKKSCEKVYVEFDENIFKKKDDQGNVVYQVDGTNYSFKIHFEIDNTETAICTIDWKNVPDDWGVWPIRSLSQENAWIHDGTRIIEINSSKSDMSLTVMSWNVDKNGTGGDGKAEKGIKPLLEVFGKKIPVPDVLLLQETKEKEISKFADRLSKLTETVWEYYCINENGRDGGNANAILSRYPIKNRDVLFFENQGGWGGRNAVYGDIDVLGTRSFRVYSAHFESGKDWKDWVSDKIASLRIQQFQEIKYHAGKAEKEAIIGGDFNGTVISDFNIGGFHDSQHYRPGPTYTCFADFFRRKIRLDYILVDKKLVGDIRQIYPGIGSDSNIGWISDHLPIWATIRI